MGFGSVVDCQEQVRATFTTLLFVVCIYCLKWYMSPLNTGGGVKRCHCVWSSGLTTSTRTEVVPGVHTL